MGKLLISFLPLFEEKMSNILLAKGRSVWPRERQSAKIKKGTKRKAKGDTLMSFTPLKSRNKVSALPFL